MKAINAFWHSHPIELANCMQWNSASWDCLSSSLASRVCFSFFFFRYRHVCFLGESKELFCGMRLHLSWWDLVLLQSSALQHAWLCIKEGTALYCLPPPTAFFFSWGWVLLPTIFFANLFVLSHTVSRTLTSLFEGQAVHVFCLLVVDKCRS